MMGGDGKDALKLHALFAIITARKGDAQYMPVLALVLESLTNLCLVCLVCPSHRHCYTCHLCFSVSASLPWSSSSKLLCEPWVSAACHDCLPEVPLLSPLQGWRFCHPALIFGLRYCVGVLDSDCRFPCSLYEHIQFPHR